MSSIMRRRNGLIALSVMEVLLSWERLWQPLDHKTGRFHPATAVLLPHPLSPALPRQRFSAMTGYGTGGRRRPPHDRSAPTADVGASPAHVAEAPSADCYAPHACMDSSTRIFPTPFP